MIRKDDLKFSCFLRQTFWNEALSGPVRKYGDVARLSSRLTRCVTVFANRTTKLLSFYKNDMVAYAKVLDNA